MAVTQQITSLTLRHYKIVDYAIQGWTPNQISEKLKMSRSMVSVVMNSPTFKHECALRRAIYEDKIDDKTITDEDEVTKALREGAISAAHKLVGHIESTDDKVSVRSCAEVLDRTGYAKKEDTKIAIGPTIIINEKSAKRIIESIELDNEPVELSESSDPTPIDSRQKQPAGSVS